MSGEVKITDSFEYDVSSDAYFSKSNNDMKKSIDDMSVQLKGTVGKGIFLSDVNVTADYKKESKVSEYADSSGIAFSDISIDINTYPKFVFKAEKINIFSVNNNVLQEVALNKSQAEVDMMTKDGININIDSELFGGKILANININRKNKENVSNAIINFKEVDISKIDGLSYDFSKLEGKLNSRISITNYPNLAIQGDLDINDGYLTNTIFLDWLSEYFDIPGIKSIEGYDLGIKFNINKKSLDIFYVKLASKKIGLDGYFKLREYAKVSSEFRLGFDRNTMKESKRFRSLLKRIKDDRQLVAFDFRLLGDINKINFQWMQSEFKEAATGVIPKFIKRKIERKIEKAIK